MDETLQKALYELLEYSIGNRESKHGNPYCHESVIKALKVLALSCGMNESEYLKAKDTFKKMKGLENV